MAFGAIDNVAKVWLLDSEAIGALVKHHRSGQSLAAFYYLEIHHRLGCPAWLDLLAGGKRFGLPTHSELPFELMLHLCRGASGNVAISAPGR
ncbi:hypothetical protein [Bradyrhizobium genosp. SA-3]|uniref:hypothetical protein n=1 Tax=Bradyrhizobium genosp. SA-3 TaxID=508868 RepID=UPI00102904B4|nr:hypothetical protein [Bradyrhizobium genosp. SA-3]